MTKERGERAGAQSAEAPVNIRWDDSNLRSLYANVCNVLGTREEIVLLFEVLAPRRNCNLHFLGRLSLLQESKRRQNPAYLPDVDD